MQAARATFHFTILGICPWIPTLYPYPYPYPYPYCGYWYEHGYPKLLPKPIPTCTHTHNPQGLPIPTLFPIAILIFNLFSWRNTLLVALAFLLMTLFLWFQGGWFIIIITFWCTAIWISLLFLCLWWRFWLWWSWSWINFLCFLLSLVSSLCRWDLVAMCGLARFHGSA